jgi:hypothetical protein
MPRQSTDQSLDSQEQRPLLSPSGRSTNETFSSFRDIGAADISVSAESLVSVASSHAVRLTRLRAVGIIASLGVLIFIQGKTASDLEGVKANKLNQLRIFHF